LATCYSDSCQREKVFILNESKVIPEFWVVALDETKHWTDGYLAECNIKQEFVVYLVDVNRHTHLASLTPSLWLEYVDHFAVMEDGFDDEKWRDEAIDATSGVGESGYYDVFDPSKKPGVQARKVQPRKTWIEEFLADEIDYDELFESVLDHVRANNPLG
jgi:hypothetical protein